MPYRKLPKTDEARLRALKSVLERDDIYTVEKRALQWDTISEAKKICDALQDAQARYKTAVVSQKSVMTKYRTYLKTTRMFISHFIQVLNMAMARGEIREDYKPMYGLTVGNFTVPELTQEQQVAEWGAHIIKGEKERLKSGGVPIYNPTIAKVAVQYDIFMDAYNRKMAFQQEADKQQEVLAKLRPQADAIVQSIWRQVEEFFSALTPDERLAKCREYGVIYYYRKNEKPPAE